MKETEYEKKVETLLSHLGIIKWERDPDNVSKDGRTYLIANFMIGNQKKKLLLEFRSNGEPRSIAEFAGRIGDRSRADHYPVLVAPFISERGRRLCERSNIGCIDLSGNIYLKYDNVYINQWGSSNKYKIERKQKNLLSLKSSLIIRSMLENPEKRWTMQELSNYCSVSLAQVYKVLDSLEAEKYIDKKRGAIRISDPSGLLDLMADRYSYDDQKIVGYYSPLKGYEQIFSKLREIEDDYALTLGAAAQLVLPVVRSVDVYLYCNDFSAVINNLGLEPVEFGGNVYLMEPKDDGILRSARSIDGVRVVSNIQLYLDLNNYPQRGREQAEAIREKILGV
ncbi:MAG: hypothetical protein LLG16_08320 [Euryarchaeota archaeon]|nr:hypothetical protein [Euryarchaeota archaeon]